MPSGPSTTPWACTERRRPTPGRCRPPQSPAPAPRRPRRPARSHPPDSPGAATLTAAAHAFGLQATARSPRNRPLTAARTGGTPQTTSSTSRPGRLPPRRRCPARAARADSLSWATAAAGATRTACWVRPPPPTRRPPASGCPGRGSCCSRRLSLWPSRRRPRRRRSLLHRCVQPRAAAPAARAARALPSPPRPAIRRGRGSLPRRLSRVGRCSRRRRRRPRPSSGIPAAGRRRRLSPGPLWARAGQPRGLIGIRQWATAAGAPRARRRRAAAVPIPAAHRPPTPEGILGEEASAAAGRRRARRCPPWRRRGGGPSGACPGRSAERAGGSRRAARSRRPGPRRLSRVGPTAGSCPPGARAGIRRPAPLTEREREQAAARMSWGRSTGMRSERQRPAAAGQAHSPVVEGPPEKAARTETVPVLYRRSPTLDHTAGPAASDSTDTPSRPTGPSRRPADMAVAGRVRPAVARTRTPPVAGSRLATARERLPPSPLAEKAGSPGSMPAAYRPAAACIADSAEARAADAGPPAGDWVVAAVAAAAAMAAARETISVRAPARSSRGETAAKEATARAAAGETEEAST
jgi:hypothetical protein